MLIQFVRGFLLEQLGVFDESLHRNRTQRLQMVEDPCEYPSMYDPPPQMCVDSASVPHPKTSNQSHVLDQRDDFEQHVESDCISIGILNRK